VKLSKLLILQRKVKRDATAGAGLTGLLILLVLTLIAGQVSAKTYRWIDDDGTVVYSQTPPRDNRPTGEVEPPPPPTISPEAAQQRLNERRQQLEDNREDEELAREKRTAARRERDEKRRACEAARNNLANLPRGVNKMFKMPDGSYRRIDEVERQAKIAEAEASIEKNCR
jgi:hypothetical protein